MANVIGRKYGVDAGVAGKIAECDGGGAVEVSRGVVLAAREFFRGRLSGLYFDEGDPPARWYEMVTLEDRPEGYVDDTVWCEQGFVFIMEE